MLKKKFENQPWAILCDLRQWGLSTPDSVALGATVSAQLDDLGRTHTAMIFGNEILTRITAELAFNTSGRKAPMRFFKNESAAWQWLAQCGFESTSVDQPAPSTP